MACASPASFRRAPGGKPAHWLKRVGHAQLAAGSEYAPLAGAPARACELGRTICSELLAAWAWYSQQTGLAGDTACCGGHGAAEMSFRRAREEVGAWRQRLRLSEYLGTGIESCRGWPTAWSAALALSRFGPSSDFIDESAALDNRLDQYADQLSAGQSAIFSIFAKANGALLA